MNDLELHQARGIPLEWRHLSIIANEKKISVWGKTTNEYRTIIDNANGWISPGSLVAIMGPSGSGKSTLMSVLANRNQDGLITKGIIEVDGKKLGKFMRQISGFVYQDDLFPPGLTVKEHLNFIAQVTLSRKISSEARKRLMSSLLTELNLNKCANTVIRDVGFDVEKVSLSGGEQKRLSVAVELLTDPALLFCDEPTTGLDSFSAFQLMSIMKKMVKEKHKTVICSIHQPNPQIFEMFDQIILLSKGKIAFIGKQKDAISHFEKEGELCRPDQNPADFLLKKLNTSPISDTVQTEMDLKKQLKDSTISFIVHEQPFWMYRLSIMSRRAFLQIMRDRSEYPLLLAQNLVSALIVALCTEGSVRLTQHGVQALQTVILLVGCELFSNQLFPIIDHFMKQMELFRREYANGTNSILIFMLSNILCYFPGLVLIAVMYTVIFQLLAPLKQSVFAFLFSCIICIAITHVTFAFGMLLSIIFKSDLAYSIAVPVIYVFSTLSGVYINLRSLPSVVSWICYISWPTYGIEALMDIQFYGVEKIECPSNPILPCWKNGMDVLNRLGFQPHVAWTNFKWMVFLYLLMIILSFIVLYIRAASRRL